MIGLLRKGRGGKVELCRVPRSHGYFGVYWDQYQQDPTEFSLFQDISRYSYFLPNLTGLIGIYQSYGWRMPPKIWTFKGSRLETHQIWEDSAGLMTHKSCVF